MTKSSKDYFARSLKETVQGSKIYSCDYRITQYEFKKLKKDRQKLNELERYCQKVLDELETKKYVLDLDICKEYGYPYLRCQWHIIAE